MQRRSWTLERDQAGLRFGRGAILRAAFAEKLANHIFDRQFLHIDIRDGTGAQ